MSVKEDRIAFENKCVGGLVKYVTHVARDVECLGGQIKLAFARGYQSGYEDKVMGRKPRHYTRTTKKMIKGKE